MHLAVKRWCKEEMIDLKSCCQYEMWWLVFLEPSFRGGSWFGRSGEHNSLFLFHSSFIYFYLLLFTFTKYLSLVFWQKRFASVLCYLCCSWDLWLILYLTGHLYLLSSCYLCYLLDGLFSSRMANSPRSVCRIIKIRICFSNFFRQFCQYKFELAFQLLVRKMAS